MTKNKRITILYIAIAVILILVLLSASLFNGLYARYKAAEGAADAASVAAFVFDVKDKEASHTFDLSSIQEPGDTATYSFIVTNKSGSATSEVAQSYETTYVLSGSMPLNVSIKKSSTEVLSLSLGTSSTRDEKSYTGQFAAANVTEDTYTITATWPADENDAAYANYASGAVLILNINSEQID